LRSRNIASSPGSIDPFDSAALDANGKGLFEPSHGSAPDLAG
jgi:3-isopropylmalate dehydrogenase